MIKNLYDQFQLLSSLTNNEVGRYSSKRINTLSHRIGKNNLGEAVILFDIKNSSETLDGLNTKNLELNFNQKCILHEENDDIEKKFTILKCKLTGTSSLVIFFEVIETLFNNLSDNPTDVEIIKYISDIMDLFSKMKSGSKNNLYGLWGELLLISNAVNKDELVKAWHTNSTDQYDFMHFNEIIEVKTTILNSRKHNFSFNQLSVGESNLYISSIKIQETGEEGVSIADFQNQINSELIENKLIIKLDILIKKILGTDYANLIRVKFDEKYAKNNIKFFDSRDIPKITSQPDQVSQIEFVSDLSQCKSIETNNKSKLISMIKI